MFQKNHTLYENSVNSFISKVFKNDLIFPYTDYEINPAAVFEISERLEHKNSEIFTKWQQFGAEAILLAKTLGTNIPDKIFSYFAEISPFNNTLLLKDCFDKKCAMAVFPLDNPGHEPGMGHIWVIENFGHQITTSHENWNGNSWKLAFELAKKALHEPDFKEVLAKEWIITGDVDESGKVKRVELGNKLTLPTKRTWLIPLDNFSQIPPEISTQKVIRSADSVETGWNHITGKGVKTTGEQHWPENIDELHILVGGNIKAQVASILLTKCRKVILWHSENEDFSKIPAQQIEHVIKEVLENSVSIETKLLSSKNIAEAEKELIEYFKGNNLSSKILFNVTSGNRLMSYAAQSIARLHPNIDLIYRDFDETLNNRFNILNYREFPPYLGSIVGKLPDNINSSFLYGKDNYDMKNEKAEDFINKLINKE